jgi:tetratricopeptide (TPR) repeat protein
MLRLPLKVLSVFLISAEILCAQTNQLTEAQALTAIELATNPSTKLAAAEDFINRFPKSSSRIKAAELVAAEILKVQNGAVAIVLVERAHSIFTADEEREILKPVALEAYATGNRSKDAFKLAAEILAKNPDDLYVLVQMTRAGAEEVRKRNREHVEVALQYGLKAIALIEAGPKASRVADDLSNSSSLDYTSELGPLYQQVAILYLGKENTDEAKARLSKAATLRPDDPTNYALLGRLMHADYVKQMETYEGLPEGKQKQETLKKLDALLDPIIDAYARAAGLALGRQEYVQLMQQVIPDLTTYYKYRNNQSTKGLQQLIHKYRR